MSGQGIARSCISSPRSGPAQTRPRMSYGQSADSGISNYPVTIVTAKSPFKTLALRNLAPIVWR